MNVLITLAGQSKRFYSAGYKKPKFLLSIGRSTIISEVIKKFDDSDNFHLVVTEQQIKENENLIKYIKSLRKNIYINIIKPHNLGPVYSALQVKTIKDDSSADWAQKIDLAGYSYGLNIQNFNDHGWDH